MSYKSIGRNHCDERKPEDVQHGGLLFGGMWREQQLRVDVAVLMSHQFNVAPWRRYSAILVVRMLEIMMSLGEMMVGATHPAGQFIPGFNARSRFVA